MFRLPTLSLIITVGLTACAHNPLEQHAEYINKRTDTTYESYTNQLITEKQPYATIRIYPVVSSFGYSHFDIAPINIKQIDDNVVYIRKNILSNNYESSTPFWELKVPVGVHNVIVGGLGSHNHTKFNMNFEQDKKYVVKPELEKMKVYEYKVYEYKHDSRFNNNTKESIILSQEVKLSDQTTIKWKMPQKQ